MTLQKFVQAYYFARYLHSRQITARLRLMAKRKIMSTFGKSVLPWFQTGPNVNLALSETPPIPIFPPRLSTAPLGSPHLFFFQRFGGEKIATPLDWHPEELEFGTRFWKLNIHYMEYLEGLPDTSFCQIVDDWIAQNVPYRTRYWADNWNSYALSIRVAVWMQQLAARRIGLADDFLDRAHNSLSRQLFFLTHNLEVDILGNHLIKNIKALLWAGRYFEGIHANRFQATATRLLERELEVQVLPDGFHFERSPSYHCQVFADLLECYCVMPDNALRNHLGEHLASMAQVIEDTTHPDGLCSLFNDGGLHYTYSPQVCLTAFEKLIVAGYKARTRFSFPDAGYYGGRFDGMFVLFDSGLIAPDSLVAHGHGDTLAFELSLEEGRIIVDAGVFEYNQGEMRQYARSTRAHNTVSLDNEDSSQFFGAFRAGRRARPISAHFQTSVYQAEWEGSHDGFAWMPGAPVHRRKVSIEANRLQFEDQIEGGAGQEVWSRLLFHPECSVQKIEGGLLVARTGQILSILTDRPISIERAFYCPDMGVKQETAQAVMFLGTAPTSAKFEIVRERSGRESKR